MKKLKHYIVNQNTMAVLPNKDIVYNSIIYETNEAILCETPPLDIINQSCIERGSTFDGRRKAIQHMTKRRALLPTPIEPAKGMIVIPTKKVNDPYAEWLMYYHIKDCRPSKRGKNYSEIILTNDQTIEVELSFHRMRNLIMLAAFIFGHFIKQKYIS